MRYALISDIHANRHALDAVLAFAAEQRIDHYVCPGDLVGYGAFPDECVARVGALAGTCVAGNHDLIVLGRLPAGRGIRLAQDSWAWTRQTISPATETWLAALPPDAELDGGAIVVAHGALGDPQHYVETPQAARAALQTLAQERPAARVLVVGHTHRALMADAAGRTLLSDDVGTVALPAAGRVLVNPGAVGQSRERGVAARLAVLDSARGEVTFHALDYDVEAARAALRDRGLSERGVHLPPRPAWRRAPAGIRRRAARAMRSIRQG